MTPTEYAVRAIRAFAQNVDLDEIPEVANPDLRDKFIEELLDQADTLVGAFAYAVIAETQDAEWARYHESNPDHVAARGYPVRVRRDGNGLERALFLDPTPTSLAAPATLTTP